MRCKTANKRFEGFTLSELLIALAVLGVIASFTIPKVLQSQQDTQFKSIAKEAAAMVAGAYSTYCADNPGNPLSSSSTLQDLTPYMNFVAVDTSSTIDHTFGNNTLACGDATALGCLTLHNGAKLRMSIVSFGGTSSTNALFFHVDPDGKVTDGTTNGPGKSVAFYMYYNGRLTTRNYIETNTCSSDMCRNPAAGDPPWFSWN